MVHCSNNYQLYGRIGNIVYIAVLALNSFGSTFCFKNVILYEGSEQFERFMDLPQPLHFKVYLFNVTNADRVQNGERPIVRELGPYVYRFV